MSVVENLVKILNVDWHTEGEDDSFVTASFAQTEPAKVEEIKAAMQAFGIAHKNIMKKGDIFILQYNKGDFYGLAEQITKNYNELPEDIQVKALFFVQEDVEVFFKVTPQGQNFGYGR